MSKRLEIRVYDSIQKAKRAFAEEIDSYFTGEVSYRDLKVRYPNRTLWFTDHSNPLKFSCLLPSVVWYDPESLILGDTINRLNSRLIRSLEYHYLGESNED